jgi:hypothetical protein
VAGSSYLMVWGVGTSHAIGGGTRRVDSGGVGAAGGTPGMIPMLARSLKRESVTLRHRSV